MPFLRVQAPLRGNCPVLIHAFILHKNTSISLRSKHSNSSLTALNAALPKTFMRNNPQGMKSDSNQFLPAKEKAFKRLEGRAISVGLLAL